MYSIKLQHAMQLEGESLYVSILFHVATVQQSADSP